MAVQRWFALFSEFCCIPVYMVLFAVVTLVLINILIIELFDARLFMYIYCLYAMGNTKMHKKEKNKHRNTKII